MIDVYNYRNHVLTLGYVRFSDLAKYDRGRISETEDNLYEYNIGETYVQLLLLQFSYLFIFIF